MAWTPISEMTEELLLKGSPILACEAGDRLSARVTERGWGKVPSGHWKLGWVIRVPDKDGEMEDFIWEPTHYQEIDPIPGTYEARKAKLGL